MRRFIRFYPHYPTNAQASILSMLLFSIEGVRNMPAPIWQVGGDWDIRQNNGFRVKLHVDQDGDKFDAACSHSNGAVMSSQANGFVTNDEFQLNIKWNNGTEGRYIGKFKPGHFTTEDEAILEGATVDLLHPESSSGWSADERVFTRA